MLNVSKLGELSPNDNAEPSFHNNNNMREGVETLHSPSRTDEDKVQTIKIFKYKYVAKAIVVRKSRDRNIVTVRPRFPAPTTSIPYKV